MILVGGFESTGPHSRMQFTRASLRDLIIILVAGVEVRSTDSLSSLQSPSVAAGTRMIVGGFEAESGLRNPNDCR
jgi:hypothetical protein